MQKLPKIHFEYTSMKWLTNPALFLTHQQVHPTYIPHLILVTNILFTCMKYFASLDAELSPPRSSAMGLETREADIREEIFGLGW